MKPITKIAAILLLSVGVAACSGDDEPADDTTPAETPVEENLASAPAEPDDAAAPEDEATPEAAPTDDAAPGEEAPADEAAPDEAAEGAAAAPDEAAPAEGAVAALADDPLENTLYIELECGRVVIEMLPEIAPLHVERIKTLARDEFYDGLTFHRVIEGFMAQTGDPLGNGMGASPLPDVRAEFSDEPFVRGAVGMARGSNPNSANSQFFIMFTRYPSLDGQYTLWGHVTEGMECVDEINRGEPPANPDVMLTVRVAADVQ